jgi:hypothetical protein
MKLDKKMATIKETAEQLYRKHGFKKANFIAFDKMQLSSEESDVDFWLGVINQVTLLNMADLVCFDQHEEGEA